MRARMRVLVGVILASSILCQAGVTGINRNKVMPEGVTEVSGKTGKTDVTVKIMTRKVDIGTAAEVPPEKRLTSCTYSRFPCSVVDGVEILVGAQSIFVARSVYADLADLAEASVSEKKPGLYVLSMKGGDGSEGYTASVVFDRRRVREREVADDASGKVRQRTTYLPQPSLN